MHITTSTYGPRTPAVLQYLDLTAGTGILHYSTIFELALGQLHRRQKHYRSLAYDMM